MSVELAVVVIGRNEGERLERCLASVVGRGHAVVYVDSGSTDGSPALAARLGAEVVALDPTLPFTAARARNAGLARAVEVAPEAAYVQFVDGDCEVVAGWLGRAREELAADPALAVVCGRRRERFPERSLYNFMADVEWGRPGATSCGGDSAMRVAALDAVGGFDVTLIAGEEPELCLRLRRGGWAVRRVDAEMTRHDMNMTRFGQWWRRSVRAGYGALMVAARAPGAASPFAAQLRSARLWTAGWAAATAVMTSAAWACAGPRAALAAFAAAALAPAAQALRVARHVRPAAADGLTALGYGAVTVAAKWAEALGQLKFWRDRVAGRLPLLIEYRR